MCVSFAIKCRSNLSFCGWGLLMFTHHFESTGLSPLLTLYHISNSWSDCAYLFIYPKYLLKVWLLSFQRKTCCLWSDFHVQNCSVSHLSRREDIIFYTIWVAIKFGAFFKLCPKNIILLFWVVGWLVFWGLFCFFSTGKKGTSRNVYKVVMRQENNRYTRTKEGGGKNMVALIKPHIRWAFAVPAHPQNSTKVTNIFLFRDLKVHGKLVVNSLTTVHMQFVADQFSCCVPQHCKNQ